MGRNSKPKASPTATTEAPLHPLNLPRDDSADEALTWLMLAAEALAAPRDGLDRSLPVEHATSADPPAAPPDRFYWLSDLAGHITATLEVDSLLSRMIDQLPATFTSAWGIQTLFRGLFPKARHSGDLPTGWPNLSERERKVLHEVSKGMSHEAISDELGIAPRTVDHHMVNIYAKLGVKKDKPGVNKPALAVARATALGLLQVDPVDIVRFVSFADQPPRIADTFCYGASALDGDPALADLKQLAGFGLMLMAVSGVMARQLSGDRPERLADRGLVLEFDRQGVLHRAFGSDRMGSARSIIQVPAHAAVAGFTPGNLLIAHDLVPQRGLNRAAISEYTSEGEYVRTFCGSRQLETRMIGPLCPVFAADGRLLVTSGWLTDGILVLWDGGRTVSRFADGEFWQIAVGLKGHVYGVQHTDVTGAIRAFSPEGQSTKLLTDESSGDFYRALAIEPTGRLYVFAKLDHEPRPVILRLEEDGSILGQFEVPGYRPWGHLECDAEGRLYVPCADTDEVKVLNENGALLQSISLGGRLIPHHVAISADDHIWICGRALTAGQPGSL